MDSGRDGSSWDGSSWDDGTWWSSYQDNAWSWPPDEGATGSGGGDGWNGGSSNNSRGSGRGSGSGGRGNGQPKKKAKAKAQAQPRDDGEELNSRARREEWRAPLLEENRELRTEITQQRVELRMQAGQGRTLRDEAQTLRSEYVEARSEEAALKTVLKLQQSINDCSQQQMLQLRSEYSSALESQQHELHELDQVEASRMVYQLCESSVRCIEIPDRPSAPSGSRRCRTSWNTRRQALKSIDIQLLCDIPGRPSAASGSRRCRTSWNTRRQALKSIDIHLLCEIPGRPSAASGSRRFQQASNRRRQAVRVDQHAGLYKVRDRPSAPSRSAEGGSGTGSMNFSRSSRPESDHRQIHASVSRHQEDAVVELKSELLLSNKSEAS